MIAPTNQVFLYIDNGNCQVCSPCLAKAACKVKAIIYVDRDEAPFIDLHRCHGCKLCVPECPFDAVKTAR